MQGDYQVPEGFYYINEFKPQSNYHMSLGLNYPNASDKIVTGDRIGDIYHGSCVTVGLSPFDPQIEELYILAMSAKRTGRILFLYIFSRCALIIPRAWLILTK
jgi:murein L,D-transpeptidase YafK